MPGIGKGPLRIAFEDFIETFNFSDILAKWIKDVGENNESMINAHFGELLDKIGQVPELKRIFKITYNSSGQMQQQGAIGAFVGLATGMGSQTAGGVLQPYIQLLQYAMQRGMRTSRMTPEISMGAYWRYPELRDFIRDDLAQMGWSEQRIDMMLQTSRVRLDVNTLGQYFLRDKMSEPAFREELAKRGYENAEIERVEEMLHPIPSISDLISIAVREGWDDQTSARFGYDNEFPSEVAMWARRQGLDPDWAKKYWRAHWQLPSPTMAYEMLHRLRPGKTQNSFTQQDMERLLKAADYPTFWRDRMIEISYAPLTRVDVRRMYKTGVLEKQDLVDAYLDLGYNEKNAKALTEFTIRYETETGDNKLETRQKWAINIAEKQYKMGLISKSEMKSALESNGEESADADAIISLLDLEKKLESVVDKKDTYVNSYLNDILDSYKARMIDAATASALLSKLGLNKETVTLALQIQDFEYQYEQMNTAIKNIGEKYIRRVISRGDAINALGKLNVTGDQQSQIMAELDEASNATTNKLTESEYRKCWQNGFITEDQFRDHMAGFGHPSADIDLLVKLYAPETGVE